MKCTTGYDMDLMMTDPKRSADMDQDQSGIIFDIKRYAIHDGPGIRTTVFFKGCPFTCAWCHNPESKASDAQILYTRKRCIGCVKCVEACPQEALTLTIDGIRTEAELCRACGVCAGACPAEARQLAGRRESVADLMTVIEKDVLFFDESGGGATFSGGEPLVQSDFLLALLTACGARGIHRAVDTTGLVDPSVLMAVAEHTDLFLFDLKIMDPEKHRIHTGVSNEQIVENLRLLAERKIPIVIRLPLIPGINDDPDNLEQTARFVASLNGVQQIDILPYHRAAAGKYVKLNEPDPAGSISVPNNDQLQAAVKLLENLGLQVNIGG